MDLASLIAVCMLGLLIVGVLWTMASRLSSLERLLDAHMAAHIERAPVPHLANGRVR